jgi:hypothetical protein
MVGERERERERERATTMNGGGVDGVAKNK